MFKSINKPKNKGVCKTPVIIQLEALECGAACLTMILAYYRKWIPLEKVRIDCGVSRDGSNAKNVLLAARHYGLEAKGFKLEPEALKKSGTFPCIVHWEFNHFIVVRGFRGKKVYINDPAKGSLAISEEDFDKGFTGVCLMFEPGDNFAPSGKKKSVLEFAKRRLKGTSVAIFFAILTSIISSLMGLISPAFSRVFLDRIITKDNPGWVIPFLVLLAAFSVCQVVVSAMNTITSMKIDGKMTAVGSASYMWKVFSLPIHFFTQRMAGDIQGRKESNASVANSLIGTFAPLGINVFMMVFYLVVMLRYSWKLTLIGLTSVAANSLVSMLISKMRVNLTRVGMRDQANLTSTTISGIELVETIKSSGAEEGFFSKWAGYQAGVNSNSVKYEKSNQYIGIIPSLVSAICNNAVMIFGVYLVFNGEFTVGMIMAFQAILTSFVSPAYTIISAGQTIMEMRTEMERIDDVMEYPVEDVFKEDTDDEDESYNKLSGNIKINNISFGYSPLAEPLITDFSLELLPGKSVALVGQSGCGKSTISHLVSGLYKPWSGEILFDGKRLNEISKHKFKGSVAVVDQDIIIFEDTIANNIKMWDESIEDFEMILAAKDAQIHDEILAKDGGYQHKLQEGGKDFSGGQRQRLEIARVLAQDPTVIILDEATSALDAKTEYEVVKAIKDRGITCIVVAHRLSTIRSCDEIIVMNNGKIIDRGTHKELLETSELYNSLVTAE